MVAVLTCAAWIVLAEVLPALYIPSRVLVLPAGSAEVIRPPGAA